MRYADVRRRALRPKESDARQRDLIAAGLPGIRPKDALEEMVAAQMLAVHDAAMECFRLAQREEYPHAQRQHLDQAGKLSRTFAMLLDSLNRHRGKGMQKITVEHVHVHSGGQAVVGVVNTPGGGVQTESENQPNGKQIAYAPQPALWSSETKERASLPGASDAERPLPDTRWEVAGRSEG
jgi:hypothetical protein